MFKLNKKYFIRTVTLYYTGELIDMDENFLVLQHVSWIGDTGRFNNALNSGEFSEVEPYPENAKVIVNKASIVDACEWQHELPLKVK